LNCSGKFSGKFSGKSLKEVAKPLSLGDLGESGKPYPWVLWAASTAYFGGMGIKVRFSVLVRISIGVSLSIRVLVKVGVSIKVLGSMVCLLASCGSIGVE
jgi:hypothetical protein